MSENWFCSTNVYEVNLRQYTTEGTIRAFLPHLHRLKDMGVQTLWFMPLTPISKKNRKGSLGSYYACADFTAVSDEFGSIYEWKHLVHTAHNMGFKVMIDWVANHTGWDHVWTVQHPDWYKLNEATGDFKIASGMSDIIELDFTNQQMRRAMIDAMHFWVEETGIDGFRCDLAFWVRLDFWQQAKAELEKTKKLFWLGELDVMDNPEYMDVFDAAYTWQWMHQTAAYYKTNQGFHQLMEILQAYQNLPGIKTWFTTNHDENSWNGTEYEKYGEMALLLAVFSTTWPGIPLIYSGQELPNYKRLEFFEKDPLDWTKPAQLHDFYKTLLQWRSGLPALHAGAALEVLHAADELLVFRRKAADAEALVLLNFSAETKHWRYSGEASGFINIFGGEEMDLHHQNLHVKGWGFAVWVKK